MFEDLLESLACEGQLVHLEQQPARPSRMGLWSTRCPTRSGSASASTRLWCHQAEAIDLLGDGRIGRRRHRHGVGQVALLPGCRSPRRWPASIPATALLVFPTKALAQDQLRSIAAPGFPGLVASTYDGDTEPRRRAWVRRNANVVLTNPEMLHVGILPFHGRWATFLMRLRYVVVDELHVLPRHLRHPRRARAAPAAPGLRALRRRSRRSSSRRRPSASRPRWRRRCAALPVRPVADDGSPRGERLFALWNPPLLDADTGARGSANVEAAALTAALRRGRLRAPSRSAAAARPPSSSPARCDASSTPTSPSRGAVLPRRLPAERAARDRGRAVRRAAARRRGHERARARHRRRRARRLRAQRLPRHHRVDVAAGRARRAHARSVAGRARRRRRPARPVAHGPSPRGVHPSARARGREPLEPVRAAAPPRVRGVRAAAVARTTSGGGATTSTTACASSCSTTGSCCANRRAVLERAGRAGARHRPAHRARRTSTASPSDDGGWSAPSTEPRAFERCTPARSTCTRASRTAS